MLAWQSRLPQHCLSSRFWGTLQYRWLGEVSDAERDRLRASLRTRAAELVDDFDREISRTYRAFHVDSEMFDKDPGGTR